MKTQTEEYDFLPSVAVAEPVEPGDAGAEGPRGEASPEAPRGEAGGVARLVARALARPELRDGTLSLVDQAAVSGASFATSVIIGRLCSKDELGVFYLVMTIVYLAKVIQEQLISAPYVVYCHARRGEARALYSGSALLHQCALSGAALAAVAGMLGFLAIGFGPAELAPALWVLLGALPLLQLREFIRRLAMAHLRMGAALAIDIGVAVLQVGSLLALAYMERLTVTLAYGVMGGACAVACFGWWIANRRSLRFQWPDVVADWRRNWGFARWALASQMIGFATPCMMPWIVNAARGSGEAGVLAACISVVGVASMFTTGLAGYLTPRAALAYSEGGRSELGRVLRSAATVYAGVLGGFALFIFLSGDFLLVLAFGGKYTGYGAAMGVLALGAVALSMNLTAGVGLCAIDRPKANLAADTCIFVVTLVLVFCLLEPFGVLGAALGDLGGKAAGAVVRCATLRRHLHHSPRLVVEA